MNTVSKIPQPKSGTWLDNKGTQLNKQEEMDFSYTNIDKLVRLSLGENPHFDCALYYNNNYSISLEEAQRQKCAFICENLRITKGSRVLDLGCGWGGFLRYLQNLGAEGIGINLSSGQVAACLNNGLTAHLKDMRYIQPGDLGGFDAVTAIGSFDHVASVEDHLKGTQDQVYDDFFQHVANLLPVGGRFYIQSMVFGKNMIPYEAIDIKAPKGSIPYICALQVKHHPNSWLPYGGEHIIRVAAPYFNAIHHDSGRLDYIETNRQWHKRYLRFNLKKYGWFLSFMPKFISNKEFRYQLDVLRLNPNRLCFEKEILDFSRIVFEKI